MRRPAVAGHSWPARAATAWCVVFALVHLFWALGGSGGLASSAGPELAARRPVAFVIPGLYGVAAALTLGVVLLRAAAAGGSGRGHRFAVVLTGVVGLGLLLRGVALEVILTLDLGAVRDQIDPLEVRWSEVLWNPWFAAGGLLFLMVAWQSRRNGRERYWPMSTKRL